MTLVSCPTCAGPVELTGDRPGCLIGHTLERGELQDRLIEGSDREARLLRDLVSTRAGRSGDLSRPADTEDRPSDW